MITVRKKRLGITKNFGLRWNANDSRNIDTGTFNACTAT